MQYLLVTGTGWILLGFFAALLLRYGTTKRFVNTARTIVYLPVVIPGVAAAALWAKIYEISPQYGLLNSILAAIGLESKVMPWIGHSSTAMWAVCAAELWKGIGYYAIIFYAGLIDVPSELEEAARIDGANALQVIRHIVIPIIRPVIIMCIVLAIMHSLRVYDMPKILTKGGPGYATTTLSIYMYKVAFKQWKYGYGSTVAIVALLLTLVFTSIVNLFDKKEVYCDGRKKTRASGADPAGVFAVSAAYQQCVSVCVDAYQLLQNERRVWSVDVRAAQIALL